MPRLTLPVATHACAIEGDETTWTYRRLDAVERAEVRALISRYTTACSQQLVLKAQIDLLFEAAQAAQASGDLDAALAKTRAAGELVAQLADAPIPAPLAEAMRAATAALLTDATGWTGEDGKAIVWAATDAATRDAILRRLPTDELYAILRDACDASGLTDAAKKKLANISDT